MSAKDDLQGLLIIRLTDQDFEGNNATSQIRSQLGFVVETANISKLLIDLGGVSFLNSETIGQLIMLKKKCDQKQMGLALCNISPKNMKVLQLVRCDEIIDLFEEQQAAIDSLFQKVIPVPGEPLSAEDLAELMDRANSGDTNAMLELGRRNADGDGVPQDVDAAVNWFRKGAENDHTDAQYELATCYAFGQGVPQDYGMAMPWYEKAAKQGHANSQYMFAMSYQYALNDMRDLEAARIWYEKAAEQGHEKARVALEELNS